MSQSHEPSYYEIALTNRQVLTVFVVLLVCVVAAFFSGVWIGRRGAAPAAAERMAELAPAEEAAEAGDEPVKELRFFSDSPRQPGVEARRKQAPGEASADTTPSEESTGRPQRPPIESAPARASADPAAKPPTPGAAETAEPPPPAAEPAPQPERVAARAPAAAAGGESSPAGGGSTPAADSGEPAAGDLVIQVFFSSDEERARALVERLGGSGYPAFLSPVRVGTQTMYRVRVGPYRERAEAEAIASKVQRAFKLDTWITQ